MDTVETVREIFPTGETALQKSAEAEIRALSLRFSTRGLARKAFLDAQEQLTRETETQKAFPMSYRLSALSDAAICGRYRRGKNCMNTSDFLRYFDETRKAHLRVTDLTENTGEDFLPVLSKEKDVCEKKEQTGHPDLFRKGKELIARKIPLWFNTKRPDTEGNQRTFPLSAFAGIASVAVSLMLIVASSVLLTRGEAELNAVKKEISAVSADIDDLKSDLEVRTDLLTIREIAKEEYGMVEENYVRMQYISTEKEESVDVYSDRGDTGVGLSALLSAIGVKK